MTATADQYWVAECQYPGRRSFWVGSFQIPAGADTEQARQTAQSAAIDFMANITPDWLSPPEVLQLKPGAMILQFEEDDDG